MTASSSRASGAAAPAPKFAWKNVLLAGVPAVLIVLAVFGWLYIQAERNASLPVDFLSSVKAALHTPTGLAAGLTDKDGDLVADSLADEAQWLDPETLEFEVLGRDLKLESEQWGDFVAHLQTVTGKTVNLTLRPEAKGVRPDEAVPPALQQARDFRAGKIHIGCLNTGAVMLAVNEGGAVPFCVMADNDGQFGYEMEIIVPVKSSTKEVKDLKGSEKVLFTSTYSHSGFKAPLMILWKEFDLQPERDYSAVFSNDQEQAIKDVAAGRGDAAPVASDLLQRILSRGVVDKSAIRSIYSSKKFPPACFAHAHQLKPELAAKIKTAFLDFPWQGTSLEKAYAAANQSKFVPASYKTDWQAVREVEEHLSSLVK